MKEAYEKIEKIGGKEMVAAMQRDGKRLSEWGFSSQTKLSGDKISHASNFQK